jgi:hypothetical protein
MPNRLALAGAVFIATAELLGPQRASAPAPLRRRRAGDARLEPCSKVWMRSNRMRWSIHRGTTRLTDRRPQFAARQVGR